MNSSNGFSFEKFFTEKDKSRVEEGKSEIGIYFDRMAELGPSFLVGLLAGYIVSKWKPDQNLEEHFEGMVKQ